MPDPIAVIAAHPDDEVLGCGATIARYADAGHPVHVLLMADGEGARAPRDGPRQVAARAEAARAACAVLGCASVELLDFPDNRMDGVDRLDVIQPIEAFLGQHRPALVLTHHAGDVNIDHRVVHDAVVVACRPLPGRPLRELWFFEVPSSTEWRPAASAAPFAPNILVDVAATFERKLRALDCYAAEMRPFPHPRSAESVEALARWRGGAAGLACAEAFELGRRVIA